jgi:uncharacterized protein DUF2303
MTAGNSMSTEVLDKIYEKGAASIAPIERPDGGLQVLVPDGYRSETIPPLEPKLARIRQSVTFFDIESFTDYVNAFKTEASRIFALPGHLAGDGKAKLTAILDYHKAGAADYGAHAVRFAPKYSEPWERWTEAKPMLQADFAEFVEENREDIRYPEAAPLLDIISKFKVSKKVDYDSVMHQANGDILIGWSERTEVEGSRTGVSVPSELKLGIPVFFKGPLYEVRLFMRYKLNNGKVTFTIKPDRHEYVEQHAFDEMAKAVAEGTGITPYLGVAA